MELRMVTRNTLKDLYKSLGKDDTLLGIEVLPYDFAKEYARNHVRIDRFIVHHVGKMLVRESDKKADMVDVLEEFTNDSTALVDAYAYKFNTLWASTQQEYNPIQNYDKTIHEVIHNDHSDRDETGKQTNSMDYGKQHTEDDRTAFTSNNINNVAVANDGKEHYHDNTKYSDNGQTHNITTDAHTDNQTIGSRIDQNTGDYHTVRDYTEAGNIGVMSAADLLEKERRIADFSFWEVMAGFIRDYLLTWEKYTFEEVE